MRQNLVGSGNSIMQIKVSTMKLTEVSTMKLTEVSTMKLTEVSTMKLTEVSMATLKSIQSLVATPAICTDSTTWVSNSMWTPVRPLARTTSTGPPPAATTGHCRRWDVLNCILVAMDGNAWHFPKVARLWHYYVTNVPAPPNCRIFAKIASSLSHCAKVGLPLLRQALKSPLTVATASQCGVLRMPGLTWLCQKCAKLSSSVDGSISARFNTATPTMAVSLLFFPLSSSIVLVAMHADDQRTVVRRPNHRSEKTTRSQQPRSVARWLAKKAEGPPVGQVLRNWWM